jgi:hypothetical protein
MEPRIDRTQFGSVTIDGEIFTHDVIIRLGGRVEKRKKKLSKAVYGTSHTISLAEAEHLFQEGVERLLIGAGQDCRVQRDLASRPAAMAVVHATWPLAVRGYMANPSATGQGAYQHPGPAL